MAKYLFCWELGQGLGHLVRYRALVDKLIAEGHEVHYLARDERRVRLVNPQKSLQVTEIQPEFIDQAERIRQPASANPATLLYNCGFFSAERLAARARQWMQQIRRIQPDCIVADHSPTAVFANKFLGVPLIVSGMTTFSRIDVNKRYSSFVKLSQDLNEYLPDDVFLNGTKRKMLGEILPDFPDSSMYWWNLDEEFIQRRKARLEGYSKALIKMYHKLSVDGDGIGNAIDVPEICSKSKSLNYYLIYIGLRS